jgi:fructose-1,6-bisphosphatase/inositol monophosphatase family enzyme
MAPSHPLLEPILALHRSIRAGVLAACEQQTVEELSRVAEDGVGDTLYAVDKVSEALLVERLAEEADRHGGLVLVAEGIAGGRLTLPRGRTEESCRYCVIVDPIDGTRELMYQKRPAWVLTGVAPNRGNATRLSDIELAVQTEIPLVKQYLADELWSVRDQGAHAARVNVLTGERAPLTLRPSRAATIEQGFAMVNRFFPGVRDELAAIDEEVVRALVGTPKPGKAACFEDQYLSSGGQLYELMVGHYRFVAELRPLMAPLLQARGMALGLCCHPYDICTALIAEELGIVLEDPAGGKLDCALDVESDVAWVGYANRELATQIGPALRGALKRRGLAGDSASAAARRYTRERSV